MTTDRARTLRLASPTGAVRHGARWESHLRDALVSSGWTVVEHPAVPGITARPDLLAVWGDGEHAERCYVEATATGSGDLRGHRQSGAGERIRDVLLSRVKRKSWRLQGIDGPLLVCVLCVADAATDDIVEAVVAEVFGADNEPGRNLSGILVSTDPVQMHAQLHVHPRALHPLPHTLDSWPPIDRPRH